MRRIVRGGAPRRVAGLVATVAALAVALAACGNAASPVPSPSPVPSASAAPSTPAGSPGAAATPLPPGSFTFDLPDGWREIPVDGSYGSLITDLRDQNPAFADSLAARLGNLADSTTYMAFDARPLSIRSGSLATLIVTEVDLPADVTLETFARTIRGQVEQLVETDVEMRPVLLTAGRGYSLAYLAPLVRPDGQEGNLAVTQVYYTLPGRGYVMTFAVPPEKANDYAKAVAEAATSFTIRN